MLIPLDDTFGVGDVNVDVFTIKGVCVSSPFVEYFVSVISVNPLSVYVPEAGVVFLYQIQVPRGDKFDDNDKPEVVKTFDCICVISGFVDGFKDEILGELGKVADEKRWITGEKVSRNGCFVVFSAGVDLVAIIVDFVEPNVLRDVISGLLEVGECVRFVWYDKPANAKRIVSKTILGKKIYMYI